MNLNQYKKYYYEDEGHWYISKIKQYNEKSINYMSNGLLLISQLLSSNADKKNIDRFKKFKPNVLRLFNNNQNSIIEIDEYSKLFISFQILDKGLIDLSQLEQKNYEKFNKYLKIKKEFRAGQNYQFFIKKYGKDFLVKDVEVYFRNFESWLMKFGFYGHFENRKICFITEAGYEFMASHKNIKLCSAIFLNQIKKIQIWNPTIIEKYKDFKVLPYFAILQILLKIPDNQFTKTEYVLFITKLQSHREKDIDKIINLIIAFRKLSADSQKDYIESIISLDKRYFPERERSNYDRILDSSSKEIGAYAFGSLFIKRYEIIKLANISDAQKEVLNFEKSAQYIDFENKYDWIRHLGSLNGLTTSDLIDLYIRSGKSSEEIKEKLSKSDKNVEDKINVRILEKEIEDYYEKNLDKIDKHLEIVKKPFGRQFPTHIGTIDFLCIHKKTKEYYVIEFKRSQVSDDTIGQVLRYMGWVYLNLAKAKKNVNGIIVGKEFSDKIHYSFTGIQSNHIYQLIKTFKHPFNEQNKPILK